MNIVIDSNILFSALIKDSLTRKVILKYNGFFLFPEFIFEEVEKHKKELLEKAGMDEKDFDKLLQVVLRNVLIVPNEILKPYKNEAFEIIKDIDKDDVIFIACVLAYPDSILWSDDRKLKKQTYARVMNTKEVIELLS